MSADRYSPADDAQRPEPVNTSVAAGETQSDAIDTYPELEPVVALAVDTVASAFDISEEHDPALLTQLEATVTEGTVEAYAPMASTADALAHADQQARDARSAAVERTADLMAAEVAQTAAVLRARSESTALQAAAGTANQGPNRSPNGVRFTAAQGAAVVHRAARATAEREREAAKVAAAAAGAADALATSTASEAREVRHTVSDAASSVRSDALDSSYQVALAVGVEAAEELQEYKVD